FVVTGSAVGSGAVVAVEAAVAGTWVAGTWVAGACVAAGAWVGGAVVAVPQALSARVNTIKANRLVLKARFMLSPPDRLQAAAEFVACGLRPRLTRSTP